MYIYRLHHTHNRMQTLHLIKLAKISNLETKCIRIKISSHDEENIPKKRDKIKIQTIF